jgi:hypothetical protein
MRRVSMPGGGTFRENDNQNDLPDCCYLRRFRLGSFSSPHIYFSFLGGTRV